MKRAHREISLVVDLNGAFQVTHRPHCSGLNEYILELTPFRLSQFGRVWSHVIRNIVTVLVPFFLLLALNFGIVYKDRCQCVQVQEEPSKGSEWASESRRVLKVRPSIRRRKLQEGHRKGEQRRKTLTGEWVGRAKAKVARAATRTLLALVGTALMRTGDPAATITEWRQVGGAACS